ncbi:MAG: UDP-N-acetylmuramate dehydrogenase [Actinomycetota bacterium]
MTDLARAEAILRETCGERVRAGVTIAPLTTFRLGGPAAIYLEPETPDDLRAVSRAHREAEVPVLVLGKGSNVLVADAGYPGIVLRLGRGFRWAAREGTRLSAGGAMPLPALAGVAFTHGLAGLEFAIAIPATVGGAVRMNAGAHGRSVSDALEEADVLDLATGESRTVPVAQAGFHYRRSDLGGEPVVTAARFRLEPGDPAAIRRRMDEARAWRRETQPLAEPNCGSVFKNPEGDHAARLVDAAGCKGWTEGGATVSPKHANFIVAGRGAPSADVARLILRVREAVRASAGVLLDPEVRLVGEFPPSP